MMDVCLFLLQSYFLHMRGLGHLQKTEELEKRKRGIITDEPVLGKSTYPKAVKRVITTPGSNRFDCTSLNCMSVIL